MSGRAAAERLAAVGVSRRDARRLLGGGFAGSPEVLRGVHLYDAAEVERLASWPTIKAGDLRAAFPHGLLVARRDVPVRAGWSEQAALLADGWRIGMWAAPFDVQHPIRSHGWVALVASVAGFVAAGAEVVGCELDTDQSQGPGRHRGGAGRGGPNTPPPRWTFSLREPGPWFATLTGHRLPNPRGPHLWVLPPVGESAA